MAHLFDAETENALHVSRPRNDEGIVDPYPPEGGNADGPGRHGSQDSLPRHRLLSGIGVGIDRVLLDVLLLAQADAGMGFRTVKGQQVPYEAPQDADGARGVEHGTPAQMGDQEAAQGVSQPYSDTEPWKVTLALVV